MPPYPVHNSPSLGNNLCNISPKAGSLRVTYANKGAKAPSSAKPTPVVLSAISNIIAIIAANDTTPSPICFQFAM